MNKRTEEYSVARTATKGGREGIAGLIVGVVMGLLVSRGILDAEGDNYIMVSGLVTGAITAAIKALRNLIREKGGFDILKVLVPALLCMALVGCQVLGADSRAKTIYEESIWMYNEETDSMYENKFKATAKSRAGVFGEVPESVHSVDSWSDDGQGTGVVMGQKAKLDNTAQVEALSLAPAILEQLAALGLGNLLRDLTGGAPPVNPGPQPKAGSVLTPQEP